MSEFDWRSPEPYQRAIKSGERADFAWETLRRSPNYRIDYREFRAKGGDVGAEFRRSWGICFRP
ncbi:transcriptional regulator domain-containing protein [Bradyrhizobium sp. USDA 3311]